MTTLSLTRGLTAFAWRAMTTAVCLAPLAAAAQTAANIVALQGLAPFSALPNTPRGKAALAANYTVTGAIQTGTLPQPDLLPFPQQQQQALRDTFITSANGSQLADGLGTRLGPVYQALAHYDGAQAFTTVSPATAALFAYTSETTASDSNTGKYFFGNATIDGITPVAAAAADILRVNAGVLDVFGKTYGLNAENSEGDPYGNARPFQTEPTLLPFTGTDFFAAPSTNLAYLKGPAQDLRKNPSFPSGHSTYGFTEALLLAILVPSRYTQEITRGADYGNDRIILGAHYAMDVIAGRTLALHDVAQLLAGNPNYVGQPKRRAAIIDDYQAALQSARADVTTALQSACHNEVAVCAATDAGRFVNPAANEAFYESTQTYGLPVVYPEVADSAEDVHAAAPEAGYLLTAAFPYLTLAQADDILTATEGPGGGFLDNGSAFGLYSRLDLYAAAKRAAALAPPAKPK